MRKLLIIVLSLLCSCNNQEVKDSKVDLNPSEVSSNTEIYSTIVDNGFIYLVKYNDWKKNNKFIKSNRYFKIKNSKVFENSKLVGEIFKIGDDSGLIFYNGDLFSGEYIFSQTNNSIIATGIKKDSTRVLSLYFQLEKPNLKRSENIDDLLNDY